MARTPRSVGPKPAAPKAVESLSHPDATRRNIPTAEQQSFVARDEAAPKPLVWPRDPGLDPQLVWRGKDAQSPALTVPAVPIYVQEKIHPEAIIADLRRRSDAAREAATDAPSLFADAYPKARPEDAYEFYAHDGRWQNRMILGDSLLVMASLAGKEGLRGQVQCVYLDPPYGIKFNSNWQPSTKARTEKFADGFPRLTKKQITELDDDHKKAYLAEIAKLESGISREPELIRAFRDTWKDGVHSYLDYLRDRLMIIRDLLSDTGSCFVQIGDENVHLVRSLMDEVFGQENFIVSIVAKKKGSQQSNTMDPVNDTILWSAKNKKVVRVSHLYNIIKSEDLFDDYNMVDDPKIGRVSIAALEKLDSHEYRKDFRAFKNNYPNAKLFAVNPLKSGGWRANQTHPFFAFGQKFPISESSCWKHTVIPYRDDEKSGMNRLYCADRLFPQETDVRFIRYAPKPAIKQISNWWDGIGGASNMIYVVQTNETIAERCILMTTDPGDLVLDPTCGSGTTAYVAEQWGRRWITVDTSRVALALARQRLMAGRFDAWLLQDSPEGARKEGEITGRPPSAERLSELSRPNRRPRLKEGFVLHRVAQVTSGKIANNAEIDVIWDRWQAVLEPLREALNAATDQAWEEWEIPRPAPSDDAPSSRGLTAAQAPSSRGLTAAQAPSSRGLTAGPRTDGDPAVKPRDDTRMGARDDTRMGAQDDARMGARDDARAGARDDARAGARDGRTADGVAWTPEARRLLGEWWAARRARQAEIDASIARNADIEYLVDKPYPAKGRVRVCGPFTVESLSPHRVLPTDDEQDAAMAAEIAGGTAPARTRSLTRAAAEARAAADFSTVVLENLRASGVQNTKKSERLVFTELKPWSGGGAIAAEGRYMEGEQERRVAVAIGPEYGTVGWQFVREAARAAVELFDTLVVCGFAFEPQVNDEAFTRLGGLTVLKARMNNDLHMAGALKPTGAGNLFVVFGEPDVKVRPAGAGMLEAEIMGLDVFDPTTGAVRSSDLNDIACWFLDDDHDGESFFVRHAYFLGGNDPYEKLRNTLKAEIDAEAWDALYSATSRPFPEPAGGRVAVKVINHYGDEVMKVFQKGRDW